MSIMRAVVVEVGSPNRLVLREVEEPSPAPSEALVRVAAVSLNRGEVRRAAATSEPGFRPGWDVAGTDRKSTRLNSSHANISYAVFCLKKKKNSRGTSFK